MEKTYLPRSERLVVMIAVGTSMYGVGDSKEEARADLAQIADMYEVDTITYLCHARTRIKHGRLISPKGYRPILIGQEIRRELPNGLRKKLTHREMHEKIASWQRARARKAEGEVARHQESCRRGVRRRLNDPKTIRLIKYRGNLLDEIEYEHVLLDGDDNQIKTSIISRAEARRRNTELKESGFRWHLMRTIERV